MSDHPRTAGSLNKGLLLSSKFIPAVSGGVPGERKDDGVPSSEELSTVWARRANGRLGVVGGSVMEMVGMGRGSIPGRGVSASPSEWDGGAGSGAVGGGAGSGGAGLRDMRRAWL